MSLNDLASRVFGLRGPKDSPGIIPSILLDIEDDLETSLPVIQNTDPQTSSRILQTKNLSKEEESLHKKGSYNYFKGTIKIIEDETQIDEYLQNQKEILLENQTIRLDNLKLTLIDGYCKLFWWDGLELTQNVGLNTAIYSRGKWHNSSNALWMISKLSETKLTCLVKWKDLPITQEWHLELKENNQIDWQVKMEVEKDTQITQKNTSIVLSSQYTRFFSSYEEGDFPKEFSWQDMSLNDLASRVFGLRGPKKNPHLIPAILFDINPDSHNHSIPCVQNTDKFLAARILQAKVDHDRYTIYKKGSYNYFKGRIQVFFEIEK
jgi:hypothetical protein